MTPVGMLLPSIQQLEPIRYPALPAGTYYLRTCSIENYFAEWWASPLSVRDCAGAQPIVVTEGQAVTGKNFQLDPGATISGTVYQSDGCNAADRQELHSECLYRITMRQFRLLTAAHVDSTTGTYTIPSSACRNVLFEDVAHHENYISEWWASPLSVRDCAGAQSIVVTEGQAVTDKNFQLEQFSGLSGDVNNNNVVDLTDAILALQVVAGGNPANISINADVNGDNRIGMADVIYILQIMAHLK